MNLRSSWFRKAATLALCFLAAQSRADAPSAATLETAHGRLRVHEQLRVAEFWGTREEMAEAQGYLLATDIIRLFDEYIFSKAVLPDPSVYYGLILPAMRVRFEWGAVEGELEALRRGAEKRLGPGQFRSKTLDREISVDDLMACNTLPDWHGFLCSSFSVWGAMSENGKTLTFRNLDYDYTPAMAAMQIIAVVHGDSTRLPYVAVTWPGLLGVFTGVNSEGVSMLSHDSNSLPKAGVTGYTPRGLIFREALQTARAQTAFEDVERAFKQYRVICGNNQHVSVPASALAPPAVSTNARGAAEARGPREATDAVASAELRRGPARIFEYDSNEKGGGVTIRTAGLDGDVLPEALCCTNHVRMRQNPLQCDRYARLYEGLAEARKAGTKLTAKSGLELVRRAAAEDTLHTIALSPDDGRMLVLIPAIRSEVVEIDYKNWLSKSPK